MNESSNAVFPSYSSLDRDVARLDQSELRGGDARCRAILVGAALVPGDKGQ